MSSSGSSDEDAAESPLEFPCDFPVKAIGLDDCVNDIGLRDHVLALVQRHAPDVTPDHVSTRGSSGARYLAVTVQVRATSRAQLDAIYYALTHDERVQVAL